MDREERDWCLLPRSVPLSGTVDLEGFFEISGLRRDCRVDFYHTCMYCMIKLVAFVCKGWRRFLYDLYVLYDTKYNMKETRAKTPATERNLLQVRLSENEKRQIKT